MKIRTIMRASAGTAFALLLAVGPSQSAHSSPPAPPDNSARVYHDAQRFIRQIRHHQPLFDLAWDGRYSRSDRTLCLEFFNGTPRPRTFLAQHDTPPGFYIRVCQSSDRRRDGNYYVNDGTPFPHMRSY